MQRLVLATGFGPFENHPDNPSGEVALGLAQDPPRGTEVVAVVLPVSFRRVGACLEEALAQLDGRPPDLILSLGLHSRPGWRLEGRARGRLTRRGRPDNDGVDASELGEEAGDNGGPDGNGGMDSKTRLSPLDVGALALSLQELAPEPAGLSWNAGGYVCEYTYAHTLRLAEKLNTRALFVHVPARRFVSIPTQVQRMGSLISEALGQIP